MKLYTVSLNDIKVRDREGQIPLKAQNKNWRFVAVFFCSLRKGSLYFSHSCEVLLPFRSRSQALSYWQLHSDSRATHARGRSVLRDPHSSPVFAPPRIPWDVTGPNPPQGTAGIHRPRGKGATHRRASEGLLLVKGRPSASLPPALFTPGAAAHASHVSSFPCFPGA